MPRCHKCPWEIPDNLDRWKAVPWDRLPCNTSCPSKHASTPYNKGASHISIDALIHGDGQDFEPAVAEYETVIAEMSEVRRDHEGLAESMPVEVLADALTAIAELSDVEREAVFWRIRSANAPLRDLAALLDTSIHHAHQVLKRSVLKQPVLRSLIRLKSKDLPKKTRKTA